MASDKVVVLDSNNFEHEVLKSDLPVLVDFGLHGVVHVR